MIKLILQVYYTLCVKPFYYINDVYTEINNWSQKHNSHITYKFARSRGSQESSTHILYSIRGSEITY